MGKTNKAWHAQHRMPEHATAEQRLAWHRAHAAACGCRPPPPDIARQIEARAHSGPAPDPESGR